MKAVYGYFVVVLSGLIILAAFVLAIMNYEETSKFKPFAEVMNADTAVVMVCSAAGGILVLYMFRALIWGIRVISRSRMMKKISDATKS